MTYPRWDDETVVEDMQGLTLTEIMGMEEGSGEVRFKTSDGRTFVMWHEQDCCERVSIEDVVGNPDDLLNQPLFVARKDSNQEGPEPEYADSYTWTFYTLRTNKGTVTLRWLGESNGYYSESVSFGEVK